MNIHFPGRCLRRSSLLHLVVCLVAASSFAQTRPLQMKAPVLPAGASDLGLMPQTAAVPITLYLAPPQDRIDSLKQFLAALQDPGDPSYHAWLSPAQFGLRFGATADQLARVENWAAANGLTVQAVPESRISIALAGSAAQVEAALAPHLHAVQIGGSLYTANQAAPVIAESIASDVLSVGGQSTLPAAHSFTLGTSADASSTIDAGVSSLAAAINANTIRVLSMSGTACAEDFDVPTQAAMALMIRQAAAQGMTVLATSGCGARGAAVFPAALGEVTAVALNPGVELPAQTSLSEPRPSWQRAPGLPEDSFRHGPDVTTTSMAAFATTINSILAKMPVNATGDLPRLGNINATLYSLGPMPGLYTQPDHASPGTWEPATGLGLVDLAKLAEFFPRGALATDVSISLASYYVTHGSSVTFMSTVKDISGQGNGAVPSGTVTFNVSPYGSFGPVTLSNGTASYTTNVLPGGTFSVTASYSGDSTYAAKTSAVTDTLTVGPENATVTASEIAAVPIGSTATLAVTVKSPSGVGTPSGKVTVVPSGTSDTNTYTGILSGSNGTAVAQVLVPGVQAGNDVFLVSCDGTDPSFTCPTQRITANILKTTPAVTLTYSPNPPVSGQSVTLQATVAAAGNNAAAPTGNVNFLNNGTVIGAGTVAGGVATLTTGNFAYSSGGNTFTAEYGGDNNYNSNTSSNTVAGGAIATTTVVSATPGSVPVGGQVTLTATVSPNQTSGSAIGGSVTFVVGSTTLCSGPVSGGVATCTATLGSRGTYSPILANYSGDANFASSTSGSQSATVDVVAGTTATTLTANPTAPAAGQSVTFTATVKNAGGSGTTPPLTGTVAFYVNGTAVASPAVTNGQATYTTTLGNAAEAVYAVYSGDANWSGSQSAPLSFNGTSTGGTSSSGITLATNTTFALVNSNVILTATLGQAAGGTSNAPFTGSVSFYDLYNAQSTLLATVSVSSNGPGAGYAQTSTTGLKRGMHVITAVYSGNSSYSTATSATVTIYITDFDVTFSPPSLTLNAGSSGSSTATVTPYTGFTGQVTLACTPPAAVAISCSFNPATVTNSGTSSLTVITTAQHAEVKSLVIGGMVGGTALAGLLFGCFIPGLRRRRPAFLACLLCAVLSGALGCTNLINTGSGQRMTSGTPSGTQYLTITATGTDGKTTVTHTQQFQVTVQ